MYPTVHLLSAQIGWNQWQRIWRTEYTGSPVEQPHMWEYKYTWFSEFVQSNENIKFIETFYEKYTPFSVQKLGPEPPSYTKNWVIAEKRISKNTSVLPETASNPCNVLRFLEHTFCWMSL